MPDAAHLIGYDVAATIVAHSGEEAIGKVNQVKIRTKSWLDYKGIKLETEKTVLIFLTKKCIPLESDITTCDTTLTTRKVINYIGVRLDPRLTFWAQIRYAATKAVKVTSLFSGLMANIGGPTQSRSRLMMVKTDSILLYGSEIWADALRVDYRLRILSSTYWTVSKAAILVTSGAIPIGLQASWRKRVWETKNVNGEAVNVDDVRKRTIQH